MSDGGRGQLSFLYFHMSWDFNAVIVLVFNANELTLIQQIQRSYILAGKIKTITAEFQRLQEILFR
jgi:hypothetical protein